MTLPSKDFATRPSEPPARHDHARRLRDLSELLDRERRAHRRAVATNRVATSMMAKVVEVSRVTLNVTADWLRLLRREHLDAPRREAVMATVDRIVREQLGLLDEIAAVGPIDGSPAHLALSEVDFGDLASNALANLARAHADVELAEEVAGDGRAMVIADRVRLARAMDRVFAAAARCAQRPRRLDVRRCKELRTVSLRVEHRLPSDGGPDDESLDDATALDLAVARGVIEAHRGSLDVSTDRSAGIRVLHARLPLMVPEKEALDGLCVLIACEDEDTRELLALLARGNGAATLTACGRAAASSALALFSPDVLVVGDELAALGDTGIPCVTLVRRGETDGGMSSGELGDRIELPTSSRELVDAILGCVDRAAHASPSSARTVRAPRHE